MLGPLFSVVEVARKHLNRILDAATICVCPVVYTDVADCLIVVALSVFASGLLLPLRWLPRNVEGMFSAV